MKAWQLYDFSLSNLKLAEVEPPSPKSGEILIKVAAVSLNFRDKAIIDGIYQPHLVPKPLTPVSDAVGTVVAIGADVSRFKIGDRVNSSLYSRWIEGYADRTASAYAYGSPLPGGLAEYMVLNANTAVKAPGYMSDEEAATLPIAALTPWHAMVHLGNLKAHDTVLVQGTGGVSIFALQIATAIGARVIATSGRAANIDRLKQLGAWQTINYRENPDWHLKALEMTDGNGVDQLLDVVGGDGLNQSIQATRIGGQVHQIGFLGGQSSNLDLMPLISRQTTLRGTRVGPASSFEKMNLFLTQHQIHPVIEAVYNFSQVHEAYQHLARGAFGKIVIRIQ